MSEARNGSEVIPVVGDTVSAGARGENAHSDEKKRADSQCDQKGGSGRSRPKREQTIPMNGGEDREGDTSKGSGGDANQIWMKRATSLHAHPTLRETSFIPCTLSLFSSLLPSPLLFPSILFTFLSLNPLRRCAPRHGRWAGEATAAAAAAVSEQLEEKSKGLKEKSRKREIVVAEVKEESKGLQIAHHWESFATYKNVHNCRALAVVVGVGRSALTPSLSSHPLVTVLVSLHSVQKKILECLVGDSLPDSIFALLSVTGDHGSPDVGGQEVFVADVSYSTAKEAAADAYSFIWTEGDYEETSKGPFEFDSRNDPRDGPLLQEDCYTPMCYLLQLSLDAVKEIVGTNMIDHVYCLLKIYTDEGQPANPDASWDHVVYADVDAAVRAARELWGAEDLEECKSEDSIFLDNSSAPNFAARVEAQGSGLVLASDYQSIRVHKLVLPGHERFIPGDKPFLKSVRMVALECSSFERLEESAVGAISNLVALNRRHIVDAAVSIAAPTSQSSSSGENGKKSVVVLDTESIRAAVATVLAAGCGLKDSAILAGEKAIKTFGTAASSSSSSSFASSSGDVGDKGGGSGKNDNDEDDFSLSKAAGIEFSVIQVERAVAAQLHGINNNCDNYVMCSREAAVYIAAVLDYMSTELVRCGIGSAKEIDYLIRRISYKHIAAAIKDNEGLKSVYGVHSDAWGGKV